MALQKKRYAKSPLQKAEVAASSMQMRFAILSVLIVSSMIVSLIFLASQTQVPQIARASGVVIPKGSYTKIDSVEGGIVHAIRVSDGDLVEAGQILIEVRNPSIEAEYSRLQDAQAFARQRHANVAAIASGIETPDDQRSTNLGQLRADGLIQAATRLELFYNAQAIQLKTIEQRTKTVETLNRALSQATERVTIQRELMRDKQDLFDRKLMRQDEFQNAQSQFEDVRARASDTLIRLVEAGESLVAAETKKDSEKLVLLEEVLLEKSELESELAGLSSDIASLKQRMGRQHLRSSNPGLIQFSSPTSIGEYIEPGQTVLEVLPVKETLVVEVKVSNTDFGFVGVGQEVAVSFDNFDARRYGKVEGKVSALSPVPQVDEMTGETYFRTNIDLSSTTIGEGPFRRPIMAGFTSVAEMQTGQSSLLSYLLRPIERTLSSAFRER